MARAARLCDDGGDMSAPSTSSGFRRAYRDSQQPIIGGRGVGTGPSPRRARCLGAGRLRRCRSHGRVWGSSCTPRCGWCCPSDSQFDRAAPGLESATRSGKRPGRVRRLTDLGPVIALGAIAVGVVLLLGAAVRDRHVLLAGGAGPRRGRPAVAAGRRGPA